MAFERGMLAEHVTDLVEIRRELSQCADLDQIRALLAQRLAGLLPVSDRVSLVFREPDGEWLRIHRLLPVTDDAHGALPRVRVDGTPVGEVVRLGVARAVADVWRDPNITFGHASHDGIRSTLSVPLRIDGCVVGAMNAGSRTVGACTEDMLRALQDIAAVVGPAFFAAEQRAEQRLAPPVRTRSVELIGSHAKFRTMLDVARRTARSDVDVLVTGETGVGKTALARAMHDWSPRRSGPFVTVHLADLTPTLVESELFGYERGAFTGASAMHVGRFESAHGGTIFLDEIGETPPSIQAKLLRVIQDRCFERVGGGRTVEIDVRIIAATRRDLGAAIRRSEFREDLFFRLGVVQLHVPALRDRRDDLAELVQAILRRLQATDGRARTLSPTAWAKLRAHAWPGNIRELESVLRRAAILEDAAELALDDFAEIAPLRLTLAADDGEHLPTLDEHERGYIQRVLELRGGVIEGAHGAARILGVPPSTLRSKMKRLGIPARSSGKGRSE